MDKNLFRNKYRIGTARLPKWDYSSPAYYFVTICSSNRHPYFGRVVEGEICLNILGEAVRQCWNAIPEYFPHVTLDESIIMPDHVHGIVQIKRRMDIKCSYKVGVFGPQSKNLGSIIRGFKIGVTKWAHENHCDFLWQPRFYENIIRDETALHDIRTYIMDNPAKWQREHNRRVCA